GKTGIQPPQSAINGNNASIKSASVNTNLSLPVTIFYLSNGVVVSNSAGITASSLPPFLSVNGINLTNGSQINATAPGITTPPSVALWMETNTFSDANLDPAYPYIAVYNYSLLTTTNLTTGWQEVCTVVGWLNRNPSVPLISTITYTNGVPETTNWSQIYLNNLHQPTNIVVYGTLPSMSANSSQPAIRPANTGPFPPGPGGTVISSAKFYTITANTNQIMTSWP
ncbi:MAG: hypothetical protein ABSE90_08135, partial [Verrucomicrobiota bacterium]